jgi:hypothetical protein
MDLAGGSCNYKGIEVLRSLESGGKRYCHGSVLPSTAEIKRAAKELENKAQQLEEMRDHLKESLNHETRMRLLLDQVHHCEGVGLALFLVMQAVPCILHCENRSCVKIITMIISEGFSNAEVGHICRCGGNSKKDELKHLFLVSKK